MRIISGIQPTGEFHIGNYLGALKNWVRLQEDKENECLFFQADLHSLTADPVSGQEKKKMIENLGVDLLAVGLDPEKSVLFIQSQVPECAELAWVFNCLTPMGELERMTQYKDKAQWQKDNINAGLFSYPTLMAADILLYQPEAVPVGDDQLQHLELARETARRFNRRYGQFFKEPKDIITATPRLMSLKNPLKKMSKSEPGSYIGVFEEPDEIRKKIKSAVAADNKVFEYISREEGAKLKDEYENQEEFEVMKAGAQSLLGLLREFNLKKFNEIFGGEEALRQDSGQADLENLRYGEIKEALAESIIEHFRPMREKREELLKDIPAVMKIYEEGAAKARVIAQKTLRQAKDLIGLP